MVGLGDCHLLGTAGLRAELLVATAWYAMAAARRSARAIVECEALTLAHGTGLVRRSRPFQRILRATIGHGKSGYKIAKACYEEGRSTGDDTRLRWASQILHWCVRNGEVRALVALGRLRLEGSGVTQSTNTAAALFERAAERLHSPGALAMGRLHWEMRGDMFRAYVWLRIAHSLGSGDVEEPLGILSESMHPSLAARAELRAQRWLTRHTETDGEEDSAVQLLPLPTPPSTGPSVATASTTAFAVLPPTALTAAAAPSAADPFSSLPAYPAQAGVTAGAGGIASAVPMTTDAAATQAELPSDSYGVPSRMPSRASSRPLSHTSSSAAAVAALTGATAAGGLATDLAVEDDAAKKAGDADAYSYYSDYSYSDDEGAQGAPAPAAAASLQTDAAGSVTHADGYDSYSYSYSYSDDASEDGDHDADPPRTLDGRALLPSGPAACAGGTASNGAGPAHSALSALSTQTTGLATDSEVGLQEEKRGEEEDEDEDEDELDVLSQDLYDYYSDD